VESKWVHSARRPLNGLLSAPGDYDDGEIGGMKIGRGNHSNRRKPALAPLCPPQIPLDQTRVWTRAAAVGSQRLTAWAMAPPSNYAPVRPILDWATFQNRPAAEVLKLTFNIIALIWSALEFMFAWLRHLVGSSVDMLKNYVFWYTTLCNPL
jgi:hypothetical protein